MNVEFRLRSFKIQQSVLDNIPTASIHQQDTSVLHSLSADLIVHSFGDYYNNGQLDFLVQRRSVRANVMVIIIGHFD